MRRTTRLWVMLAILLVAAFVRVWQLHDAPPGLQHDEIFKAMEGRLLVEQGHWEILYASNQGHEGAYVWLLGLSYLLFDYTLVMIRFPALMCSMLTVALLYRVAANVYGHRAGVIASALGAVSFWGMFTGRVGLRAVLLLPVILAVLWGVWAICVARPDRTERRWRAALLTGALLGFAIYTYTSSFALYAAYGVFVGLLALLDRQTFKKRLPELLLIGIMGVILASPMLYTRLTGEEGMNRAESISFPWQEFRAGRPGLLIDNAKQLAGMFAFTGDPEWRYNIAGRPVFPLPVGLLVYVGLGVLIVSARRRPFNVLLVALAVFGVIPSLLTLSAPSFLRSIVILPTVVTCVAVAVDRIGRRAGAWGWLLGVVVVGVVAVADFPAYFDTWANAPEVHRVYLDDMEQLARYLREHDESLVLVSTYDADLDAGPYAFHNPPPVDKTSVVFFNGSTTILLSSQPALLLISPSAPITPPHADWLTDSNGTQALGALYNQNGDVAFEMYRLNAHFDGVRARLDAVSQHPVYIGPAAAFPSGEIADWGRAIPYPVNFGGLLALEGVEIPRREIDATDDGVNLQLYLRPLVERVGTPLNIFVHLTRLDGTVAAQRDLMGVPPPQWSAQTVFIQDNYVVGGWLQPGRYILAMGLYDWATGERFWVLDESGAPVADRLVLGEIDVIAR